MTESDICQSCGMPMTKEDDHGTRADAKKSAEYCRFCYQNGKFTDEGVSMEEKIEKNVAIAKRTGMPEDAARKLAEETIPKLSRWKK